MIFEKFFAVGLLDAAWSEGKDIKKSKKSCRDLERPTGPGNRNLTAGKGVFGNLRTPVL
jgi:hypothetical protein